MLYTTVSKMEIVPFVLTESMTPNVDIIIDNGLQKLEHGALGKFLLLISVSLHQLRIGEMQMY